MNKILRWGFIAWVLYLNTSFTFKEIDVFTFNNIKTLVLDAGHGGKDPGTSGTSTKEKNISLDVVLKIEQLLKSNYPNLKVLLTRRTDEFIELAERANIANKNKADFFISVHCNANDNKTIRGSETYVMGLHKEEDNVQMIMNENASILLEKDHEKNYDGFDPHSIESYIMFSMVQNVHLKQSLAFASKVEKNMIAHTKRKSRGVKQAGFLVLWKTTMPSVLIEIGFLTHKEEEKYLNSTEGKSAIAKSIFKAITEN